MLDLTTDSWGSERIAWVRKLIHVLGCKTGPMETFTLMCETLIEEKLKQKNPKKITATTLLVQALSALYSLHVGINSKVNFNVKY